MNFKTNMAAGLLEDEASCCHGCEVAQRPCNIKKNGRMPLYVASIIVLQHKTANRTCVARPRCTIITWMDYYLMTAACVFRAF